MTLAADRDLVARQYASGFREVLGEALPDLRNWLASGRSLETSIVATYLNLLARHPDSLVARKFGMECAREVSRRSALLLGTGWPESERAGEEFLEFDAWLRRPDHRFNPGTTADLVTAALYAALREGEIRLPRETLKN